MVKRNLFTLCEEALERFPQIQTITDKYYFKELSINFKSSVLLDFIDYFSNRFQYPDIQFCNIIGKRLLKQWDKSIGSYDSENVLSNITDPFWPSPDSKTKESLMKIFLSFIDSCRRPRFPQMQLANKLYGNGKRQITQWEEIYHE